MLSPTFRPDYWVALARLVEVMRRTGNLGDVPGYLQKSEEFVGTRASLEPGLNFCKGNFYKMWTNGSFWDFFARALMSILFMNLCKSWQQECLNGTLATPTMLWNYSIRLDVTMSGDKDQYITWLRYVLIRTTQLLGERFRLSQLYNSLDKSFVILLKIKYQSKKLDLKRQTNITRSTLWLMTIIVD